MTHEKPPSLDTVCARAVCLPCAPTLLPRLVAALQNEQGTAQEVESIIMLDAALAAATLRLANSAFFSAVAVDTVEDAIIRLGEREIYRLAALALVSRWDGGQMNALRWGPGDFARHALCRALAAEVLAELTGRLEPQSAYTAGLVCGLGKLALAHSGAAFYDAVRAHCERTNCTWDEAERSVFGYSHAEVGAKLLRTWHFPELFAVADAYLDSLHQAGEPMLVNMPLNWEYYSVAPRFINAIAGMNWSIIDNTIFPAMPLRMLRFCIRPNTRHPMNIGWTPATSKRQLSIPVPSKTKTNWENCCPMQCSANGISPRTAVFLTG